MTFIKVILRIIFKNSLYKRHLLRNKWRYIPKDNLCKISWILSAYIIITEFWPVNFGIFYVVGFSKENYISNELQNVTLTVLDGAIFYEIEDNDQSLGVKLSKGDDYPIETGMFHRIHTISSTPSSYMYTFINKTKQVAGDSTSKNKNHYLMKSPFPLLEDVQEQLRNVIRTLQHICSSCKNIFYQTIATCFL